jgi:hypothetical protein
VGWHCAREQGAQHHVAAGDLEEILLVSGVDPFGVDLQPQSMAQRDNRGNDRAGIGTMAQALDEAAIDLDPVLLGNGLPKQYGRGRFTIARASL